MGGAITHEVVRLHNIYEHSGSFPPFPVVYYLLTPVMIIGGGLFAAAWEDDKAWKCFYLGVTVGVYVAVWSAVSH